MASRRSRRSGGDRVDLAAAIERLAERVGGRIGADLARALSPAPTRRRARCAHGACARDAVAKGLCKSHYNLMLYHRRKARGGAACVAARER